MGPGRTSPSRTSANWAPNSTGWSCDTTSPWRSARCPRRLEEAAEPYLESVARKGLTYTFTVLDCDESNAFSHPGGYVYVCRGLFDWIAEEEDYALEFVVAHEMAHVDLGHAADCLRDPEVKKIDTGTVPLFYAAGRSPGATSRSRTSRPTAGPRSG